MSGLGQDNIGRATSSVGGTLDTDTDVGTGQGGPSLAIKRPFATALSEVLV